MDFIIGTNNISDLNQVLDEVIPNHTKVIKIEDRFEENVNYLLRREQIQ